MTRGWTWGLVAAVSISTLIAWTLWSGRRPDMSAPRSDNSQDSRVVSLSPGVTETIEALGASDRLVGLSDYCSVPEQRPELPRVGSAITPNYERLATLEPDLILSTEVTGEQLDRLDGIAPTHSLPWLTVPQVSASLQRLGELLDRPTQALALARRFERELPTTPPETGPRILLALDIPSDGTDIWFVRQDSLHGALLHAAGARHAVPEPIDGPPKISVEDLLDLQPDGIIVLRSSSPDEEAERAIMARLRKLTPLRAVQEGRLAVVSHPELLHTGPQLLAHRSLLNEPLDRWFPDRHGGAVP